MDGASMAGVRWGYTLFGLVAHMIYKGYSDLSLLGLRCQETRQLAMLMP
jgi:hypothetical protein